LRILYVTPAFHHPTMRGPTRCYHFTRELGGRHAITLLSLTQQKITPQAYSEMGAYTERIVAVEVGVDSKPGLARLAGGLPGIGSRLATALERREAASQMRKAFLRLLDEGSYDVVLFHGKDLAPVIEGCEVPIVVDFCDATSMRVESRIRRAPPAQRPLLWLRYLQVRRIERKLLRASPHVAFVSCRDREAIVGPSSRGEVVSIGVDHDFWTQRTGPATSNTVAFAGIMSYGPNEDAALVLIDEILPRVRRSVPDAEFMIVGRDPSAALTQRAESVQGVTVTGFVDDMRDYLERAAVSAVPMRYGSGVQNKVLEAMAMETPVVATSMVAAGLRIDGGEEAPILVADDPGEFAERVVKLLQQPNERARLATAGRQFVEQYYDWSRSAEKLERMCIAAASERGS
jgi:glycosyltransferase involved in cell wall biosynthesis